MPSVKVLEAKKAQVEVLKEKFSSAVAGVVVDYKGTTVADDTQLRKELRRNQADGFVRTRGTHVGQLLALADVDSHILVAAADTHNHARIDGSTGPRSAS